MLSFYFLFRNDKSVLFLSRYSHCWRFIIDGFRIKFYIKWESVLILLCSLIIRFIFSQVDFDPAYSTCNWFDVLNCLYQSKCPNLKGQSLKNKIRGSKLCLEKFDVYGKISYFQASKAGCKVSHITIDYAINFKAFILFSNKMGCFCWQELL